MGAGKVAATDVWQGEQVKIETAFAKLPTAEKRVKPYVEALVDPFTVAEVPKFTAEAGVELRAFWGLSAVAKATQRLEIGEPLRTQVGIRKTFELPNGS